MDRCITSPPAWLGWSSPGSGGKAGIGPSFTWKASSAIAREDFLTSACVINPPDPAVIDTMSRARTESIGRISPIAARTSQDGPEMDTI
jgi:hypothetical protein